MNEPGERERKPERDADRDIDLYFAARRAARPSVRENRSKSTNGIGHPNGTKAARVEVEECAVGAWLDSWPLGDRERDSSRFVAVSMAARAAVVRAVNARHDWRFKLALNCAGAAVATFLILTAI